MPNHPDDVAAVQQWLLKHVPVRFVRREQFVSIVRTDRPNVHDAYYYGAIYDDRPVKPVRLVIRTHQVDLVATTLTRAGWSFEVIPDPPGAPRIWIEIPHARASEQSLNELLPLIRVWGTRR